MKNEDSSCLVSIFLMLSSVVPLVVWADSPRNHLFLGIFGLVAFVAGIGFGIHSVPIGTEPGQTIPEMTKTVPATSGISDGVKAMKKAAGSYKHHQGV